jgi:iron complex outermembrane receptor protein
MDLLRSVPGVTVSGNDQIRVNGKSEVQVMINGKVEQLTGDQLQLY